MRIGTNKAEYGKAASFRALTEWYDSAPGSRLLEIERAMVGNMLGRRFGYHLLQLGCADLVLHEQSPMGHRFSFTATTEAHTCHSAVARSEAIPLASSSIDLVLLHHALDYSAEQHQLLREAARVLISGGHLVIVGFNPFSAWGLRNRIPLRSTRTWPWPADMLGTGRLTDWLQLLDFQIEHLRYGAYFLPFNSRRLIRWTGCMEQPASRINWPTGGIYVIAARKQVVPLTPIQNRRQRLQVPGLIMPVADKVSRVARVLPKACNEEQGSQEG